MTKKNLTETVNEILNAGELNHTKSQVMVMEQLLKAEGPLSREEIIEKLGKDCPDKTTVYRILERFYTAKLVHRVYLSDRAWKYELAHNCAEKQCHPHFTCSGCGETFCLHGIFLPLVKGLKKGFVVHRQQVKIEGLCSSCSK